jgi:PIN domain nuclease of toxin-antitoxin system
LERRGRIRLRQPFELWAKQALEKAPIREAPLTLAVTLAAVMIQLPQPDPGGVFLAATAMTFGLTLATGDGQLIECPGLSVMANK